MKAPTSLFLGVKLERSGIHAISQATWLGPVLEQMAQMTATLGAMDLRAPHEMAVVVFGLDRPL